PPKGHRCCIVAMRAAISQVKGQTGRSSRIGFALFCRLGDVLLKQTPLNAVHRAAGAKMVDFGGWDMPVSYGSQIEEHLAVRRDAGMFDVSHMLAVDIEADDANEAAGEGARDFLRYALANNVDKLTVAGK